MELAKYIACICEGAAEQAIIDVLLDQNLLIFSREELLEEEVIRCREGRKFETKYLRKGFSDKISVIRILDSRRENFKLSNYDGNIFLKPLTFSFSPRRPESNENYDVVPSDEECLVFDNFNFKLAVLNELIYEQELIKPYFDIYDYMKFKKAHWNLESERNIRAAVQFFKDLQVPVRYADKIVKNQDVEFRLSQKHMKKKQLHLEKMPRIWR